MTQPATGADGTVTTNTGGTPNPAAAATGTPAAPAAGNQAASDAATAAAAGAAATGTDAAAAAAAATDGAAATGAESKKTEETPAGETPKAPDKYTLALPEGGLVDASDVAAIEAIARTNNWTNDEAQAALTEHANALHAQSERFLVDLKQHAEIGGDKLAGSQQRANAVLDRFLPATSPEGKQLRADLNKSGYANYAPMVLLLARIGKSMSEDTPFAANAQRGEGTQKRDAAAVLYGG